jgi:hypothetical protein
MGHESCLREVRTRTNSVWLDCGVSVIIKSGTHAAALHQNPTTSFMCQDVRLIYRKW